MAKCEVCFRQCEIREGALGFCGARTCRNGRVTAANYGRITSLALDPIEKKPLARFFPGSMILSAGSYGCNLRCPFCQNFEISWSKEAMRFADRADHLSPEELVRIAEGCRDQGNIGAAFTYNEPLIGYEYVRDAAKLLHEKGMKTVLVTNGTASLPVLEELLPFVDAMNVDLKGFTDRYYREVLGGSFGMVKDFIARAVKSCHVEVTCLIVPGENDSEEEMRELSGWIADLDCAGASGPSDAGGPGRDDADSPWGPASCGAEIPLHISRFFPRFHMKDRPATRVSLIYRLAEVAREKLKYVYTGNC